jgi:adsorption protein B
MDSLTQSILAYRHLIEILAIVIAILTAISSVDDMLVDLSYWCLKLFGRQDAKDREIARRAGEAAQLPERPFAIMVPAWKEHDVIFSMVATNSRLLAYANYHYFIGVYQNDAPTINEVHRAQALFPNVHIVTVPRDGPTSKADCLNEVIIAIFDHEARAGTRFAGIALHDAEDFIHPHELKVFNSLIGDFDFIQLPVFSFTQKLRDLVGGIYMDEFAEVHTKDLLVRNYLSGLIPCAGVSACFSREAILRLAESNRGEVFRTSCFTEDYDIAFRLRALGLRTTFVSCPVNYTIDMDEAAIKPIYVKRTLPLSTREFFPSELRAAYRQRARWLIGIVFQGTSSHGWKGSWGTKYFLMRDRKGIITGPAVILGYFVLANLVLLELILAARSGGSHLDYVLLWQPYVMDLFFANFVFLTWRILHRMIFTARIYDWRHGLMAAPRLVVSNFVNFFAAVRATRIYVGHCLTGKPLLWDKTAHSYPIELRAHARPVAPAPTPAGPQQHVPGYPTGFASRSGRRIAGLPSDPARVHARAPRRPHWIPVLIAMVTLAWGLVSPTQLPRAYGEAVLEAAPADQAADWAARDLVDRLSRAGRKPEALAEADRFVGQGNASAQLRAQRGFLRRELDNPGGAAEDFAAALLVGRDLSAEQRRNVEAGLAEARAAQTQADIVQAETELKLARYAAAADRARAAIERDPASGAAMRLRVEALAAGGQKREALEEADRFVRIRAAGAGMLARRGFLRREFKDLAGAIDDFNAALAAQDLTAEQRRNAAAGLAEAQAAQDEQSLAGARAALKRRDYAAAGGSAAEVLQRTPSSEDAALIRIEALSRQGRRQDALAEADAFIGRNAHSSAFRAQRGFLRRLLDDTAGAADDFAAALAAGGLTEEQQRNTRKALAEAQAAAARRDYDRAQLALSRGNHQAATQIADSILRRDPHSEIAMRIRLDALSRAGRKQEVLAQADQLIAAGHASSWVYAQRGFARRDAGDFAGAVSDLDAALARGDLDQKAVRDIRYVRADAAAALAQREGNPKAAEAAYVDLLHKDPQNADGWYRLGYHFIRQGARAQAAGALGNGLRIRPVGSAYLDEGEAYMFSNAPLASQELRKGLDRWYAGDVTLAERSQVELERVKNEVVDADASIRTNIAVGGIGARPEASGGSNALVAAETRVRFDGRYLPSVVGLEAFGRGFTGKDSNGERETDIGAGVRYRPLRDVNFYVGGVVDHFFQPKSETELVVIWGLGFGADAYPYVQGWKPYWDAGTFGAWRTADGRVLEDVRGNAGYLYEFRAPVRAAIGPTVLGVAGYDNKAATPVAAGIGPSVLSYFWLGGDKYRSYDALLSVQIGYLFNLGSDERQRGWRAQVGLSF